jgi:hypothetical protein
MKRLGLRNDVREQEKENGKRNQRIREVDVGVRTIKEADFQPGSFTYETANYLIHPPPSTTTPSPFP